MSNHVDGGRLSSPYEFLTRDGNKAQIEAINDSVRIEKPTARSLLINSFINEYKQYLKPEEIDAKLKHWFIIDGEDSVEEYYSQYFDSELKDFKEDKLYWIEARLNSKLVGWATYEKSKTPSNSCYMNLIVVDPAINKNGIGAELVRAVVKLPIMPKIKFINLLLRKANQGGKFFYSKLGFKPNPDFKRDNFVDVSLLEGWTLELDNAD